MTWDGSDVDCMSMESFNALIVLLYTTLRHVMHYSSKKEVS